MELLMFICVTVIPVISGGLTVRGPSGPLVAPLGSSVILPCYVDEPLLMEGLEVEWRRTDSETLVHLFQDGESRPEAQQQDYQDRAHFFTEEIKHGNFSLRLDNMRAEDKAEYTCTVHSQQESGETEVQIKYVERLLVSGSDRSISASVGEDVTLNCSVDSHITPENIDEVSWKKTNEDNEEEDILVLLYQNNETFPDSSDERYRDRVEFFTAEIPKGNFSVRLKSVRTEDKGVYMCQVFAGRASANATVVLEKLGFSAVHLIILILCVSASGSALLLFCLIYCRSPTEGLIVQKCSNVFVSLGGSVVIPCHLPPNLLTEDLKVEWKRTRRNSETLVHLYEDGAEKQQQDYKDRAHFFTENIKHGNFSLRLDNLRAGDEGRYTCTVHSKRDCVFSAKTNVVLKFFMSGEEFPLGSSVVLPCQVKKRLLKKSLKVEWRRIRRTDSGTDSETLVHLYEDGESRADEQHEDFHKRAHFSNKKIKDGDFSLRLEKLRAGDEGVYTCKVYSGEECVYSTHTQLDLVFTVKPCCHTPALLRDSVVLPCYEERPSRIQDLKVEWRRADSDTDTDSDTDSEDPVHLYEDGESRADKQQQDYKDRAHFFTEEIKHGNFSLRLDNLRAGDEGRYTCTVHSGLSQNHRTKINVVLRLLDTVFRLQMLLVFCPNILMFLAFVLWGFSEGSVFESVSCSALYFLRPLMLLWTAPYINNFTGKIYTWVLCGSYVTEYILFSAVFYSVLFKSAYDKSLSYAGFEGVMIIALFVIALLLNLLFIIYSLALLTVKLSTRINAIFDVLARISLDVLPTLQFVLLFFSFGSRGGFLIVAVLPVFLTVTRYDWDLRCGQQMGCSPAVRRSVYFMFMLMINAVMVYFYSTALENEKDRVGWVCLILFLQTLWTVITFTISFTKDALLRVVPVYVFGSVGVVLLNAVALMTELTLRTVNGEGAIGDLRIIVFSSEFLFTLILMILMIFEPWIKPCVQSCQNAASGSNQNQNKNQNPAGSYEMKPLLREDQDTSSKSQLDSVVSLK